MRIMLDITDADIDRLMVDDALWRGYRNTWLSQQEGEYPRFHLTMDGSLEYLPKSAINYEFTYALFIEEWSDVMVVRAFLLANDRHIQILSDECGGWVILTEYERLYRRAQRAKHLTIGEATP